MQKIIQVILWALWLGHAATAQVSPAAPSKETVDEFYDAIFSDNNARVKAMLGTRFPAGYEPVGRVTPLQAAIWQRNEQVVKWLVEGGAAINSNTKSAVLEAAEKGTEAILVYLVERGGDIRNTPAFYAAGANGHYRCARWLLLKGANQELGNADGKLKVFETAVRQADYAVLDALRLNQAELDYHNCDGETALIIAVKQGNADMVRYLLKRGVTRAKRETFDCGDDVSYGKKPVEIARSRKYAAIAAMLK